MTIKHRLALLVPLLMVIVVCGCAEKYGGKPKPLPPGAINQYDAESYITLMGAQAVLDSFKADLALLPPGSKPVLNKALQSYNIAETAWHAYHSGASNDKAGLVTALAQATADVATLMTTVRSAK